MLIANPQIKLDEPFFTADFKSTYTPDGKQQQFR